MRRSILIFAFCTLLSALPLEAATFTVKQDGTGNFTTIQACANAVQAGDSCLVSAGVYNEHVKTAAGGSSEVSRVIFKADGVVTMQGFDIKHPYVTVDGFDITGYSSWYLGHVTIYAGGDFCRLLNNTIRDGISNVYGIYFYTSSGNSASNALVRGNRLTNLLGVFLTTAGRGHLFESNVFEYQNSQDYVRLFGNSHVFRRNVFWRGTTLAGAGNHPDVVQTFGVAGYESQNHLFEENWIEGLPGSQFSQMNSGDGHVFEGILWDNVKDIVFRRNIIASVGANANIGMPGVRFENNTFYRMALTLGGIGYGGSLTRGDASRGSLRNNIFLAGGSRADNVNDGSGFYGCSGAVISREVIMVFVTKETDASGNLTQGPLTSGIYDDLRINGYIDSNGKILAKAEALTDSTQLVLNGAYASYKQAVYDHLLKTVQLNTAIRSSFLADYNYVAGSAASGFAAKKQSGCVTGATSTDFNFCEPHGLNGGDPRLADLVHVLGPDGIPFTLDDGLKPSPASPLCAKGEGGTDIGAYSCDPGKVFDSAVNLPPPPVTPPPGTGTGTLPPPPDLRGIDGRTFRTQDQVEIPPVTGATGFNWEITAVALTPASRPFPEKGEGWSEGANAFANAPRFALAPLYLTPGRYTMRVQSTNSAGVSAWVSASITLTASDLASVKVYPNPWKSGKHTGDVTFANLPTNATVKIFTVSGHLVRELSGSGTVTWNLKNDSGDKAASGIFLYVIEANGSKTKGKVAVIR